MHSRKARELRGSYFPTSFSSRGQCEDRLACRQAHTCRLTCTLRTALAPCAGRKGQDIEAPRASCESVNAPMHPHTTKPTPVSIATSVLWMVRIRHPLSPTRSRNGSRWIAVSEQAEKNRSLKQVLLEKEGHDANSTTHYP